ncbi:MAG TPA: hypothetical protein DCS07_15940 [Bdellovibrionales bacterium]|nr:hypothetical protein [Bdellovibrionales bacterium]
MSPLALAATADQDDDYVDTPAATPKELTTWNKIPKHRFGMKWKINGSESIPASKAGNYSPENALDGNPASAWCFQNKGAWIDICDTNKDGLNMYTELKAIAIIPGFAKSDALFQKNGRVTKFRVTDKYQPANSVTFEIKSIPNRSADAIRVFGSLEPHRASPEFEPLAAIFHGLHKCLRIEVLDFIPGKTSKDVCISEIIPQVRWDE